MKHATVRKDMLRGLAFVTSAWLWGALAACAPLVASHDTEVGYKTVETPTGPLRLAVIDEGKGPPLILLHGFATSSYTWHAILPELAKAHRVIAVDLRGFGASDKPLDEHYSIFDQADAIEALIRAENLHGVTVIGHSFGGGVALAMALRDEQRSAPLVRNLVLIDTIAFRQPIPIFFKLLEVPVAGDIGMTLVPPEVQAAQGLRLAYFDRDKISARAVAEYASTLYSPAAKHALSETVAHIVPDNIDELQMRYATLRQPTLILWCAQDKVVPLKLGQLLHNTMRSEFVVFADCGHMPQEERPDDTARTILAFLARNRS